MFLILKHVDKENSEYLANANYPKQKIFPNITGAPSVHTEQIIWISRLCLKKNIHTLEDIFCFGGSFQIFT